MMNVSKPLKDYLIHSYIYYKLDSNIISDDEFNSICRELENNFNKIVHPHKKLVDLESLKANTGYDIKYPTVVKDIAIKMLNEHIMKDKK